MLRKIAFKILWHVSWRLGYMLQERKMVAQKVHGNDPRELPYLVNLPYSQLGLPTSLGSGLRFYPLSGNTSHPFLLALKSANPSDPKSSLCKVLKRYNELVTLKSPNDFLGFGKGEGIFVDHRHPYEYTYPWSTLHPEEVQRALMHDVREENLRYGLDTDEALDLGLVTEQKLEIEAERLLSLFNSIKDNGFKQQKDEDPIGGFVLIDGDNWRWIVQGGQHRAAVLAALGYEAIPVYIKQVVRREDVCYWPGVQSGLYDREAALHLFDRLFAGYPPPVASDWVTYVNSTFYTD